MPEMEGPENHRIRPGGTRLEIPRMVRVDSTGVGQTLRYPEAKDQEIGESDEMPTNIAPRGLSAQNRPKVAARSEGAFG